MALLLTFIVLTSAVSLVTAGKDKFRELQLLYAATEERVHYIFIPDPRTWPRGVLSHLREKNLIRSEYIVDGVRVVHANSYIVKADDNDLSAVDATILRVDEQGLTEEFSAAVAQDGRQCFSSVHTINPRVVLFPGKSHSSHLELGVGDARQDVRSDLWRLCENGLVAIRPQHGDQERVAGSYSGAYRDRFTMTLELFKDSPPKVSLQECEPGTLGKLVKVVYHNVCNFLIVHPIFQKNEQSYFFRIVLTPGITDLLTDITCKKSKRSYDLVRPQRERSTPRAPPSCAFYLENDKSFSSSNIFTWDQILRVGFTVRHRGIPRRSGLTDATFTA